MRFSSRCYITSSWLLPSPVEPALALHALKDSRQVFSKMPRASSSSSYRRAARSSSHKPAAQRPVALEKTKCSTSQLKLDISEAPEPGEKQPKAFKAKRERLHTSRKGNKPSPPGSWAVAQKRVTRDPCPSTEPQGSAWRDHSPLE